MLKRTLHDAAETGDVEEFVTLATFGRDADAFDMDDCTPLHYAARFGQDEMIEHLLAHGVNNLAVNRQGGTALHEAASSGHVTATRLLLEQLPLEVDGPDGEGKTPLHVAAYAGQPGVVRLLLDYGFSVEPGDQFGRTALHYAAMYGHSAAARILVEGGANVNANSPVFGSPLHEAVGHDRAGVTQLLLSCDGIEVNARDMGGNTPFHLGVQRGAIRPLELLLAHPGGADLNARNADDKTPLMEATGEIGSPRMADFLRQNGATG